MSAQKPRGLAIPQSWSCGSWDRWAKQMHGSCIEKNFRMLQYRAEFKFVKNRKKGLRKK